MRTDELHPSGFTAVVSHLPLSEASGEPVSPGGLYDSAWEGEQVRAEQRVRG